MRLTMQHLKQLVVSTVSGTRLGRIQDIILDSDSQSVVHYEVRSFLGRRTYLIAPRQVVTITADRMVVEDATISTGAESAPILSTGDVTIATE